MPRRRSTPTRSRPSATSWPTPTARRSRCRCAPEACPVPDLLVVGDANPDLVLRGGDVSPAFGQREQLVEQAELTLGGSGAIVACGAARLGLEVAMVARVGDDELGRFTRERLREAGVDCERVEAVPDVATGISVGLVKGDDRAILTAAGAMTALDPGGIPDSVLSATRHVHVASP